MNTADTQTVIKYFRDKVCSLQAQVDRAKRQIESAQSRYVELKAKLEVTQQLLKEESGEAVALDSPGTNEQGMPNSSKRTRSAPMRDACETVVRSASEPMKPDQIHTNLKNSGLDTSLGSVHVALRRLVREGKIEKAGYGLYRSKNSVLVEELIAA